MVLTYGDFLSALIGNENHPGDPLLILRHRFKSGMGMEWTGRDTFPFFIPLIWDVAHVGKFLQTRTQDQGPVVQNIVSLTSSLRGQLVKCFTTL